VKAENTENLKPLKDNFRFKLFRNLCLNQKKKKISRMCQNWQHTAEIHGATVFTAN